MVEKEIINFEGKTLHKNKGLKCPACGKELYINYTQEYIPHFGETQFIVYVCSVCNYRNVDLIPLEKKKPLKQEFKIRNEEDLKVKVVRGSDTKLELKELGISLEPGVKAEVFYSNIESILLRFKKIVEQMLNYHLHLEKEVNGKELDDVKNNIKKLQEMLINIKEYLKGKSFTLVLESEKGMGKILSENAINI